MAKAKLPWVDMVTVEPCGAVVDCRGGLRDYLRGALGDSDLADELAVLAVDAARSMRAPYVSRLVGGLDVAVELRGVSRPEGLGRGLMDAAKGWRVFPDAASGIAIMRDAGYRVALVSDVEDWLVRELVEGSGLRVDAVYGAMGGGSGEYVSRPRAIFSAYRDSGVPLWRGLHAGADVDADVRPAMVLGLRTAWVNRYGDEEPEEGIASEYVVESLEELAEQLAEGDEGRDLDGWLRRESDGETGAQ
ncbi:MAG: HAD family hydrolase [Conexivisphaera sp.]